MTCDHHGQTQGRPDNIAPASYDGRGSLHRPRWIGDGRRGGAGRCKKRGANIAVVLADLACGRPGPDLLAAPRAADPTRDHILTARHQARPAHVAETART